MLKKHMDHFAPINLIVWVFLLNFPQQWTFKPDLLTLIKKVGEVLV